MICIVMVTLLCLLLEDIFSSKWINGNQGKETGSMGEVGRRLLERERERERRVVKGEGGKGWSG